MNPSTALARVLVDELVRGGVEHAVLAPGSRSAPVALALAAEGRLALHVRIDERSAGFLALGLVKATAGPVPVLCTSGTAAANLHPAVLEAALAGVPLVVLTADRPPELRATGANQTIDQVGLYGAAVRFAVDVGVPEARVGSVGYWRSVTARALAAATDPRDPGPVHLNLAFREPLVPDPDDSWSEPLDGRVDNQPWTATHRPRPAATDLADLIGGEIPERGAVVVAEGATDPRCAIRLAESLGWPVLSEPTGNARIGEHAITGYPLLLADAGFAAEVAPEVVLVVGKPGLSRSLLGWLGTARRQILVDPRAGWADPLRRADAVVEVVPTATTRDSTDWLRRWRDADRSARTAIDRLLDTIAEPSEPRLARDLHASIQDSALLLAGSSRPIRDLEAYAAARAGVTVLGNRGVSGIDGLVSTAVGAALGSGGPAYALLGDLAFLHDHNGLILGPGETRPDLTIVVADNDGGGIFSMLPPAGFPDSFERVFGTPHGLDLAAVATAAGWPATVVEHAADLPAALADPGPRVVVVRTDRAATADLHRRLQRAVSTALG
ncbi:2-succinyl-5-enolpyruvyl-6-hydroxy-3-cyclohexene-1-carboxylic-acid synthase [soil metagenome]